MRDWVEWHLAYQDPESALSRRLERVRQHLANAIDDAPPGQIGLVSLCAGQGHDVLGVLPDHRRRDDVRALLIEFDPSNAGLARRGAQEAGLTQVQVREADAGDVSNYADALPAQVLLLCGIFGNISDAEIERVVRAAPALCAPGATVIWTRHRREPDLTPRIRSWFEASGFDEVAFDAPDPGTLVGVGVHRLSRPGPVPATLPDGPLFAFRAEAD
ncbi:MAG TPA: SAM-dependent methyltransferase [Streptosporangiaceae bacterium]|nr:SAM-dependent methyltransferase [Streptosporangiaceae bacterium]